MSFANEKHLICITLVHYNIITITATKVTENIKKKLINPNYQHL